MATLASPLSKQRSLSVIAGEIISDWSKRGTGINYAAKPYLQAMLSLDSVTDNYGMDDARSIVLYFLNNARSWRGDVAARVKAELKGMVKR